MVARYPGFERDPSAVEYPYQFHPFLYWEIEQKKLFEAVTDWNAAHPLQIAPTSEDWSSATGVRRHIGKGSVRSRQKSVGDFKTGVFGIPEPLPDEVAFRGFALNDSRHHAVLRDLRDSNCFSASRRMSSQS